MKYALVFLIVAVGMVLADGQYYVPRSYYVIDSDGHSSEPIPLRRLRRSASPVYLNIPMDGGTSATANANANAYADGSGSDAKATANANAYANGNDGRGHGVPGLYVSSAGPALGAGQYTRQAGRISAGRGRGVIASSSVGMDSSGSGYYDQYTGVNS